MKLEGTCVVGDFVTEIYFVLMTSGGGECLLSTETDIGVDFRTWGRNRSDRSDVLSNLVPSGYLKLSSCPVSVIGLSLIQHNYPSRQLGGGEATWFWAHSASGSSSNAGTSGDLDHNNQ